MLERDAVVLEAQNRGIRCCTLDLAVTGLDPRLVDQG